MNLYIDAYVKLSEGLMETRNLCTSPLAPSDVALPLNAWEWYVFLTQKDFYQITNVTKNSETDLNILTQCESNWPQLSEESRAQFFKFAAVDRKRYNAQIRHSLGLNPSVFKLNNPFAVKQEGRLMPKMEFEIEKVEDDIETKTINQPVNLIPGIVPLDGPNSLKSGDSNQSEETQISKLDHNNNISQFNISEPANSGRNVTLGAPPDMAIWRWSKQQPRELRPKMPDNLGQTKMAVENSGLSEPVKTKKRRKKRNKQPGEPTRPRPPFLLFIEAERKRKNADAMSEESISSSHNMLKTKCLATTSSSELSFYSSEFKDGSLGHTSEDCPKMESLAYPDSTNQPERIETSEKKNYMSDLSAKWSIMSAEERRPFFEEFARMKAKYDVEKAHYCNNIVAQMNVGQSNSTGSLDVKTSLFHSFNELSSQSKVKESSPTSIEEVKEILTELDVGESSNTSINKDASATESIQVFFERLNKEEDFELKFKQLLSSNWTNNQLKPYLKDERLAQLFKLAKQIKYYNPYILFMKEALKSNDGKMDKTKGQWNAMGAEEREIWNKRTLDWKKQKKDEIWELFKNQDVDDFKSQDKLGDANQDVDGFKSQDIKLGDVNQDLDDFKSENIKSGDANLQWFPKDKENMHNPDKFPIPQEELSLTSTESPDFDVDLATPAKSQALKVMAMHYPGEFPIPQEEPSLTRQQSPDFDVHLSTPPKEPPAKSEAERKRDITKASWSLWYKKNKGFILKTVESSEPLKRGELLKQGRAMFNSLPEEEKIALAQEALEKIETRTKSSFKDLSSRSSSNHIHKRSTLLLAPAKSLDDDWQTQEDVENKGGISEASCDSFWSIANPCAVNYAGDRTDMSSSEYGNVSNFNGQDSLIGSDIDSSLNTSSLSNSNSNFDTCSSTSLSSSDSSGFGDSNSLNI